MSLEFINVETPPTLTLGNSHYFCDYIELVALFSCDDSVSSENIYDRFYSSDVINEVDDISSEEWNGSNKASEYVQNWRNRILYWFQVLESRQRVYNKIYPFEIIGNTIILKGTLDGKAKLYIGLLLASCNKYHNKMPLFSSVFEEISKCALKIYLGYNASVHCFGVSQLSDNRYVGSLKNKIIKLAEDIHYELTGQSHVFREGDNGDGGVDIVAWLPFPGDANLARKQLFFGQSATGKNWITKQGSVVRIKNYIHVPDNTQNALFVPYDLRDIERRFEEEGKITACLLFDRFRILNLVNDESVWNSEKGADFLQAIEDAINLEEDLV